MVKISPTERLEAIAGEEFRDGNVPGQLVDTIRDALAGYSDFLRLTHEKLR